MRPSPRKPYILVFSNRRLFESFFTEEHQRSLSKIGSWQRLASRVVDNRVRTELKKTHALITTWDSPQFTENLLDWAPRLQMIGHCGGEVKGRFARRLFEDLVITNAASPMARHVAELAVAFLLYFARNVDYYRAILRTPSNAIYRKMHLTGGAEETILDSQIGMIGFGRIGRAIADMLRAFGVRPRVYDPYVPPEVSSIWRVQLDSLEGLLSSSKYLIIAAALTEETRGMLSRRRLMQLPPRAVVINVARGALIELEALTELVLRGRLRCALDVTDPHEPLPVDHPLRHARGAILTPHVGSISRAVRYAMTSIVLADLGRHFAGQPVENRVTTEMLDRMT